MISGLFNNSVSNASTSQSAIIIFDANAAKEAAIVVFPVPPFPLATEIIISAR